MKTAIVILSFNGANWLRQFLPSVIRYSEGAEIVVVDNGSSDGSERVMQSEFGAVRLLRNEKNRGFAGGYNWALKQIEADFYILLNSDIEVTDHWWQPLINAIENDQKVVASQPKIRSFAQKNSFEHAGAAGGFIDLLGYPFCRGRLFDNLEKDEKQYDQSVPIFWASGACIAIRAKEFHAEGGFDADFFAHMEEIDLCWRLKNRGFEIIFCPQSLVYHVGGGTLAYDNPRKIFLNFRNGLAMLFKNSPSKGLFFRIFLRLCLDGVAAVKFLLSGSLSSFLAVAQSHFAFYAQLPQLLHKRKALLKTRITDKPSGIYPKSIVWAYFMKGKKYFSDLDRF
jgi:GT2 family glycosyltransferase